MAAQEQQPIRGILFDKDGTLFHFHRTWSDWTHELILELASGSAKDPGALADALGFDLGQQRFRKASPVIAGTLEDIVRIVRRHLPEIEPGALRARLMRSAAAVRPVPAAPLAPLLDALLRAGLVLGVATNDAEAAARTQLAAAGVLDRFAFLAGYDSGHGAKPGTGMLLAFCAAQQLHPTAVVMIGDSAHDLRPARQAGMAALGVLSGPAEEEDLAPLADAVLPDISALPAWLAARRRPTS